MIIIITLWPGRAITSARGYKAIAYRGPIWNIYEQILRNEWSGMDFFGKVEDPHLLTRQPQRASTSPRAHHPNIHPRSHIVYLTSLKKSRKPLIPLIKSMK